MLREPHKLCRSILFANAFSLLCQSIAHTWLYIYIRMKCKLRLVKSGIMRGFCGICLKQCHYVWHFHRSFTFTRSQIFRQVKTETICRKQIKCYNKLERWKKKKKSLSKSRKHCVKRTKCWLAAFSPFPTIFSNAFSTRNVFPFGSLQQIY